MEDGSKKVAERNWRLIAGYAAIGVLALAFLAVGVSTVLNGGGRLLGNAHIDQMTGSTNGISPDTRLGTPAPHVKYPALKTAALLAKCKLYLGLRDEGHKHLSPADPQPHYHTNPPTSGDHIESPFQQADGAYSEMPEDVDIVHSLEHGRLAIQYSSNLSEVAQLKLVGLYDTMWGGTLLFPNTTMPYAIAATTWTNLLGCKSYSGLSTIDAIRDFGRLTWGHFGGEPVQTFDLTAPTPFEPSH